MSKQTTDTLERAATGLGGRFYGVHPATVSDNQDPLGQGRVAVLLPMFGDTDSAAMLWARVAVPFAGNNRGTWFIPDVDDEVLVAFESGDAARPIVIGSLWNWVDRPPETMDSQNSKKRIVTRTGVEITLDDDDRALTLKTPAGRTLTFDDTTDTVEINDNTGNTIKITNGEISVSATTKVKIAAAVVEIEANMITADTGMAQFSGVVKCDTMIANSVVASSYTPGAGNIA
ncbi:MAG: type IV secretion protein Rhs [Anaerolineae bacterium]|nr:type IV secretion protein Rhs [Anaerolineae bacterium]